MKNAIQLYTVRDSYKTPDEFKNVLKQIKDMGYEGVEFAGYGGLSAEELKTYLKEIDLTAVSTHHGIADFEKDIDSILAYASELGLPYVVCSFSVPNDEKEAAHVAEVLRNAVEAAQKYNIKIGYHNHTHEFKKYADGSTAMSIIEGSCGFELDTYWAFIAKNDPVAFIKDHRENMMLVHLKDGNAAGTPCALGEGINDIPAIYKASEEIGIEWAIVENDDPVPDGISDAKRSADYLIKICK